MTLTKGKGKLAFGKMNCPPPTTPAIQSNCGPKQCGIWCKDGETCQERENVHCVKEPCCPKWHCQGIIPTTTPSPFPPPPTVSPSSSCCKERMYKDSTYVLVAEDETLPSCGNDCIYRKEGDRNNEQLYCFPTSVSVRESQCDFKNMVPQTLVGFFPWSEWTRCQGDCGMVGRSTRNRACAADITDELSCNGPTKQARNCEIYCKNILIQKNQNCDPSTFPKNVRVHDYPCTYNFMPPMDWNGAQGVCREDFEGKLWEPANVAEYAAVVNAAEDQANSLLGSCRWWLGLFNWNDGSPNSIDAYLSSTVTAPPTAAPDHDEPFPRNGVISNFITVNDGNDLGIQNCVHTLSTWQYWRDDLCTREKPFICQSCPPPCSCSYNGVSYPCGSIIKRNPHCCSDTICNKQGIITEDQMLEKNGKPASGCCIWQGKMYKDGESFGPFWSRKVCCRGEILSKRWRWKPFPLPSKPSGSVLTITEGNETIVQENVFSNLTGILEIKVPSHKNYTDSVFILHQNSRTTMLKTNNTCQISALPGYINVSAMAQQLEGLERENSTVTEAKTVTTYVLKARKSRYGIKRRNELLPEIQDQCHNEPVIQTDDLSVNQTQFEKYNAGELILVKTEKKTRACETHYVCSKEGPIACGYGWTNPDPNATVQGFTFHQVSDGSICVNCNIELHGPPPCDNGFCECKDIKNKIDLMDCVLDSDTDMNVEEDGEVISQKLTWKKEARSITITSPAHKDLESVDIVMHAATNGYWHGHVKNNYMIKIGDECFVSTLPRNIFPVDIALGIQEIKKGNNITIKEDEVETQGIIVGLGPLGKVEESKLHTDIKNRCSNANVQKFKEMKASKEQTNDLKEGKVIFIEHSSSRSNCELLSAATTNNNSTSCWRWPNPDSSAEILVHHVVTSVITLTCCQNLPGNHSCCADDYPDYCICEDIVDSQTFELCIPPLVTDIISEDLDENGTRINVSQKFIFNRQNSGSMRIEVEAHKDYEEATLMLNDSTVVLRRGNSTCSVKTGPFSVSSTLTLARMVAEIKNTHGEKISIEDQTRQDYILLQTDKTLNVEGILDICDSYNVASFLPISSEQSANLNSGDIIFVDNPAMGGQASRSLSTCELKEACATNNGSSCFRIPMPDGDTIYVHSVISSPVCMKCCSSGSDANLCDCSDITDADSFQFCTGPRPNALLVVTGVDTNSETFGSIEILTRDKDGNYVSKTQEGCYVENFPVDTSSPTGALIKGVPHVCVGYKEGDPSNQCYGLASNGSWNPAFQLDSPLSSWGSSVLFDMTFWWLVGGDPDGTSTEVYSGAPNAYEIELPAIINQPCMVKISDAEAFLSAIPKFESASSNFAWLYNIIENKWTRLPNSLEKRSGPSCGFLQTSNGRYIVLAGGYKSSTSEILNLKTNEWSMGPDIGVDLYGGSMVSVMDGGELILIGGYSTEAKSQILKMNSSMLSWEPAGFLNKPRFNAVAMTIPIEHLPANFDTLC